VLLRACAPRSHAGDLTVSPFGRKGGQPRELGGSAWEDAVLSFDAPDRIALASQPPRFDPRLGAWILSRYADVAAALRDTRLGASPVTPDASAAVAAVRRRRGNIAGAAGDFREETMREEAARLLRALPSGQGVELVRDFAAPWSFDLALRVLDVTGDAAGLIEPARIIFLAAAKAEGGPGDASALSAAAELSGRLAGRGGEIGVQAFVALSQTLPCVLAACWRELVRQPTAANAIRKDLRRVPDAVEELLRHSGPARAVFRLAREDLQLGGLAVRAGDRVILMIAAANRDPTEFPDPGRLNFSRGTARHLAFGAGQHPCTGAGLVRAALRAATSALLASTVEIAEAGEVAWLGGFAIRGPATLPVVLHRGKVETPSPADRTGPELNRGAPRGAPAARCSGPEAPP
jgi:cytochrome P450